MRGEVTQRAISLTKPRLRSDRAAALLEAIDAAAAARQPRVRTSSAGEFARVMVGRMMDLGWTLANIRMTVERERREI